VLKKHLLSSDRMNRNSSFDKHYLEFCQILSVAKNIV
jgi:hypothetical protein